MEKKVLKNVEIQIPKADRRFMGLFTIENNKIKLLRYNDFMDAGHKVTYVQFRVSKMNLLDKRNSFTSFKRRQQNFIEIVPHPKDIYGKDDFDKLFKNIITELKSLYGHKGTVAPKELAVSRCAGGRDNLPFIDAFRARLAKENIFMFSKLITTHTASDSKCEWVWRRDSAALILNRIDDKEVVNAFADPVVLFDIAGGMSTEPCHMVPWKTEAKGFQCAMRAERSK